MAITKVSKKYPFMYFTSVNRRVNPYLRKDSDLIDCVNWWTEDTLGSKKVRPGYTEIMDRIDNDPVRGLFYVKFPNGNRRLLRVSGGKIYMVDPNSASSWGSAIHSQGTAFVRPGYTVLNALAHIVSQPSSSASYYITVNASGTATALSLTSGSDLVVPHLGKTIVQYHRRVYVGSPYYSPNKYGSRMSYSVVDYQNEGSSPASPWTQDLNDDSAANYRDVDLDYAGDIHKLTNINDRLMIYKEEAIYRFNETSIMEVFGMSSMAGSVATMPETKQDYMFTNEGFFRTDGETTEPVGEGWYPIIKQILKNGIDPTKIHSYSVNFLYFCYLGTVTYDGRQVPNACFVYNAYYDELSLFSFAHDITAIGHYVNNSNEKVIIFGDSDGFTYKFDYNANKDNASPIFAKFRTKNWFFDSPQLPNQLVEAWGFATRGSGVSLSFCTNMNPSYVPYMELDDAVTHAKQGVEHLDYFNDLSMEVSWNGSGVRPEFYGVVLNANVQGEGNNGS